MNIGSGAVDKDSDKFRVGTSGALLGIFYPPKYFNKMTNREKVQRSRRELVTASRLIRPRPSAAMGGNTS